LEELNMLRCFLQGLGETFPWVAIVMALQDDADGICAIALEQIADKGEVAEGLAHFLAPLIDHAGMHPEAREWLLAGEVFRLGNLTGVVWEGKVSPTTVNVELWTEVVHRHGATFDMPTGTP